VANTFKAMYDIEFLRTLLLEQLSEQEIREVVLKEEERSIIITEGHKVLIKGHRRALMIEFAVYENDAKPYFRWLMFDS